MRKLAVVLLAFAIATTCQAGAWGAGSFDNDDALDWVASCTDSRGHAGILLALKEALKPSVVEAPEAAVAIAAAEVVAAANGKPGRNFPKRLSDWLERQPRHEIAMLAPVAAKALARVKDPEVSELRQLWDEASDRQWIGVVTELEKRLDQGDGQSRK